MERLWFYGGGGGGGGGAIGDGSYSGTNGFQQGISFVAPTSTLADYESYEEGRHLSIISTGYDPELNIVRGDVTIPSNIPGLPSLVLSNPSPEDIVDAFVSGSILALSFGDGPKWRRCCHRQRYLPLPGMRIYLE